MGLPNKRFISLSAGSDSEQEWRAVAVLLHTALELARRVLAIRDAPERHAVAALTLRNAPHRRAIARLRNDDVARLLAQRAVLVDLRQPFTNPPRVARRFT